MPQDPSPLLSTERPKPRRPTLKQVAAKAGVSEITASRAMRGAPHVKPGIVARVKDAASELGYVPNRVAGALAGQASNQIGVVVPSLSNIVFTDVLRGLEERLEAAGFHPVLGVSNYDPKREAKLVRSLLSWRPAGIVIAPAGDTEYLRALLHDRALPMVEIMDVDGPAIDMSVGVSHRQAGQTMAHYLIGRGYRRIAYAGHDLASDRRAHARMEGFRTGLADAGLDLTACLTSPEPSSTDLGRRLTAQLLDSGDTRPEAVFYSNDDVAVGGVYECFARGLRLPQDIALAGFNGLQIGQSLPQPLTTIGSRRHLIGEIAADQILQCIDGKSPVLRVDVGFSLLPGGTA